MEPGCVGWSAGYRDPEADRENYLHSLVCCPAGHYGCECDGMACPFEGGPDPVLSDTDRATPGQVCAECGAPATEAVEWAWRDDSGRWWVAYCGSCYTVAVKPFEAGEERS
jgi:hypothetical protein